jgi:hypothetical protein
MKFRVVDDLEEILRSDAELVFCDLEDTLLAPNLNYKSVGVEGYKDVFFEICKNVSVADMMYFGKNFRRELLQDNAKHIIDECRSKGRGIFALTSGFPSKQKRARVMDLKIFFDGFLFTKGADKGPFLVNFLSRNPSLKGKCLFIDNDEQKIVNVGYYFNEFFGEERSIDLLLYKRKYNKTISLEDFHKYWSQIARAIQSGKLTRK